ncbi:MAG: response regulator transcription factor [Pseudomonadota bacterium]|nr:MAG: response regulator transcription factor [Pseudomonadota bacterium]
MAEPTVHVVDDDEAIRDSMTLYLKSMGLNARTYASAEEFLAVPEPARPSCLVADVRMPGMSGLELQKLLRERGSSMPIIFITGHGDIVMAVDAMKEGASDFLEKPLDNSLLLERILENLEKDADTQQKEHRQSDAGEHLARLTAREREVMDLLVEGKLNKVIAAELGISVRTVEAHRARVMEKLGARSLSDIVRLALSAR